MDTKRDKFVRLAEQRVNRALRELRLIGNLSNRSAYSFTEEDIRKMFRVLQKELEAARGRFSEQDSSGGPFFKL